MADRPKLTVDVEIAGAKQGINDLEAVAEAQEGVGKAAEKASKDAEASTGRWRKLVTGLKEGAGAAAGAAAGLSGMAITLKGELDPETQKSVGALQGLSGVLAAFGPFGALASVAVSGVATAVAYLGGETEDATEAANMFTVAWRQIADAVKTGDQRLQELMDKEGLPGVNREFRLLASKEQMERFVSLHKAIDDSTKRVTALTEAIKETATEQELSIMRQEALAVRAAAVFARSVTGSNETGRAAEKEANERWLKYLENSQNKAENIKEKDLENDKRLAAERKQLALVESVTNRAPGGPRRDLEWEAQQAREALAMKWQARQRDIAAEDAAWQATIYAEQEAAAAAHSARLADLAAEPYLRMQEESERARAKQAADREFADANAQRDAIRSIEAEAATLIGIYDNLRTGVTDFGAAAVDGYAAAAVSAAIYGGSQMEVANQVLAAEAEKALVQAAIATATGFGYLAAAAFGFGPGVQAAGLSFLSAGMWGAVGGAAALGAELTGGFGGAGSGPGMGAVGPGGGPATGRPEDFGRSAAAAEPQDRELFINLTSGGGAGQPLSRGDAGAVIGALVQIAKDGGLRLETRRA